MNKEFLQKITEIQEALLVPKKQYNDFSKFHYRSCEQILEALKPHLLKKNLMINLSDELVSVCDRIYIKSIATITDGENTVFSCGYARESESKKGMDTAQITGSCSSYARKYALSGLLALDDSRDIDSQDNTEIKKAKKPEKDFKVIAQKINQHAFAQDESGTLEIWIDLTKEEKQEVWEILEDETKNFIKKLMGK